jgi:hypothetical protein
MAIRLTESRLRQIIREEVAGLTGRRRGRLSEHESTLSSKYWPHAAAFEEMRDKNQYTDFVDAALDLERDVDFSTDLGENVAEDVFSVIPEIRGTGVDAAVLMDYDRGGRALIRFLGNSADIRSLKQKLADAPLGSKVLEVLGSSR